MAKLVPLYLAQWKQFNDRREKCRDKCTLSPHIEAAWCSRDKRLYPQGAGQMECQEKRRLGL